MPMNAAPIFADEQFMSAQEKATVFRAWIGFLKNRFAYQQFTNALYEHLTLHCSFIAHYNRAGFHEFYFGKVSPSTFRFLDQFDPRKPGISAELGATYWINGPTGGDLNRAMREGAGPYVAKLREACLLEMKQRDLAAARALAGKYGLVLAEGQPTSTNHTPTGITESRTSAPTAAHQQPLFSD